MLFNDTMRSQNIIAFKHSTPQQLSLRLPYVTLQTFCRHVTGVEPTTLWQRCYKDVTSSAQELTLSVHPDRTWQFGPIGKITRACQGIKYLAHSDRQITGGMARLA